MKASEFDSRLRDLFDAEEVPADPEQWNRLAAALPGARVRISRRLVNWMRAVGWAAVFLLAAGSGYYWLNRPDSTLPPLAGSNAGSTVQPAASPSTSSSSTTPTALSVETPPATAPLAASNVTWKSPAHQLKSPAAHPPVAVEKDETLNTVSNEILTAPVVVAATLPAPKEERPAAIVTPAATPVRIPEPLPAFDAPARKSGGATALGVAGGYRYSGQNAGYALGLSLRQRLGKKVFLDGDVAYLGSSGSTSTSRMNPETYNRLANPEPGSSGTASRQPLPATRAASLSYLQVAPALSYQVLPALSIGAGPDVQRIIAQTPSTADDQLVQYDQTSAPEYIPAIDWGLSGKAEYSIGRRLRAGIQYRHGLNNALRNEPGITYIERSYMQVQLRVFLLK